MARVLFKYGNYSEFIAATIDENAIYFIEDTQQIYKGSKLYADATSNVVKFGTEVPVADSAKDGVLYVITTTDGVGIYVKSGETIEQIGGGNIKAGAITDIDVFDDSVLVKTGSDLVASDDTKIPTAGAVQKAIAEAVAGYDKAFINVVAQRASDDSGTILTFIAKNSPPTSVTIADLFLTSADYDPSTHILTFTVKGVDDPVSVDMSTLVSGSLSDVIVGEDESFTVELGTGGTLGGFKTGDAISKDMSLETIVKKLLMKQVPPTYTAPAVAIANNSGTAAGSYEIGTTITPKLKGTFTQNDAGELTSITIKKGTTEVGTAGTVSPHTVTDTAFTLVTTTSYSCTVEYAEGEIKNDNLGEPYPEGHIVAGSKTSSNYTFTPYRQGYFMGSSTSTDSPTSDTIRELANKKNGAYSKGTFKFTVPVGAAQVIIACPATNTGVTKVLNESALNADVTNTFTQSTVEVEGAEGYTSITYNVWTFTPPEVYGQSATLAVTLG